MGDGTGTVVTQTWSQQEAALLAHLGDVLAPTSKVAACIKALASQPIPNEPNTAAQGSKRMVPGAWLYGYAEWTGLTPPSFAQAAIEFLDDEECWRNLSVGGPAELVALDKYGAPIVSKTGKAVPVTVADAQHFELLPHLLLGAMWNLPLAQAQASALLDWGVAWAKESAPKAVNPRELGWMLVKSAEAAKVQRALGIADPRPGIIAKAAVSRLKATLGEENGVPWLVLNVNADPDDSGDGSGQADHGFCRCSFWMHAVIVYGLGLWLDVMANDWAVPFSFKKLVRDIYRHGVLCLRHGMALAESMGALPGGAVDDWDPTHPTYYVHTAADGSPKWDGVMLAFAVPGLLTVERHAPKHWEWIGPRVEAYYQRADRFRFNAGKPAAMDHHSASVAIQLASFFGWREV